MNFPRQVCVLLKERMIFGCRLPLVDVFPPKEIAFLSQVQCQELLSPPECLLKAKGDEEASWIRKDIKKSRPEGIRCLYGAAILFFTLSTAYLANCSMKVVNSNK